ncbi:hypothetical protein [Aeromicrobium chenweiae]|uniref:Uncharacterized protein n=1 Tax=Aeromicrobium chenweiae TaxID=2079793 RepID=A0A2S0WND8_9ACTN|nr:hypothetical protein [Aeromicrobium chenweiae]AWB92845.1 hypothetical protein C3E78_11875 [Aeromicrobium chenweiae]TGN33839.1 hypothetical protein E4L97_01925 [Aeromicrobium chenweiae]
MTGTGSIELTRALLGPVSLPTPAGIVSRQVDATTGHLWHWQGDGNPLLSLLVGVRSTRLGTPTGPERALGPAIAELSDRVDQVIEVRRPVEVAVEGALGSSAAVVTAVLGGREARIALVLSTDGTWMHRVEIAVLDTDEGRAAQEQILGAIRVHPWERPA